MASWHRRLFDSNERPSFVQKPYIVFLFKNLNTYKPPTHTQFTKWFSFLSLFIETLLLKHHLFTTSLLSSIPSLEPISSTSQRHVLEVIWRLNSTSESAAAWYTHAVTDRRARSIPALGSITARTASEFHRINTNWWYRHIEMMLHLRTERRNASIQKSVWIGESNWLIVAAFASLLGWEGKRAGQGFVQVLDGLQRSSSTHLAASSLFSPVVRVHSIWHYQAMFSLAFCKVCIGDTGHPVGTALLNSPETLPVWGRLDVSVALWHLLLNACDVH